MNPLSIYQTVRNFVLRKLFGGELLKRGLFDESHYRQELLKAGFGLKNSLLDHYLQVGEALGLQPHPFFDPLWYLEKNPDAAIKGQSALLHYLRYGSAERRKPHILFDHDVFQASLPLMANEDRDELDPIARFVRFSAEEFTNPNYLFDTDYYCQTNPEVMVSGDNPFIHYLEIGSFEGRSPSKRFDESWYREVYSDHIRTGMSALEFHLADGVSRDFATNQTMSKRRSIADARDADLKTILIVAHTASTRIYGSERSLIDVLSVVDRSKYRIVLAIPEPSLSYVEATRHLVDKQVVCKHLWWAHGRALDAEEVAFFDTLIRSEDVSLVYTNTIMLREPLAAARQLGVPTICHVREVIDQDAELVDQIGESAEDIIEIVKDTADYIIGNSPTTAKLFFKKGCTFTIPNAVDTDLLDLPVRSNKQGRLKVGMLSSNIPKKGINDLYELAKLSYLENLPIDFLAFGPTNSDTQRIESDLLLSNGRANLTFPGYCSETVEALEQIDVVISLSRFAESFGRTVAEGMAARRPVIAYSRGGPKDIIVDGKTGFLISADHPEAALVPLKRLLDEKVLLRDVAEAGRKQVEVCFSLGVLETKISQAFELAISQKPAPVSSQGCDPKSWSIKGGQPNTAGNSSPVTVIIPNYNYQAFLPQRINSILDQTHRPHEIVFLDDCSTDGSILIAEEMLSEQFKEPGGIPYRIIPNGVNRGVYSQWLRAIEEATTDWIWIAEADDTSDPKFLEYVASKIDEDVNLIYAQSNIIDENGAPVRGDFLHHTDDIDTRRWRRDFVENGTQTVVQSLAFRNTIPNASAAIIRKRATAGVEDKLGSFRFVGDWLLYAHVLRSGGIAYVSDILNGFRRHTGSITKSTNTTRDYLVELATIRAFISEYFPILPRHIEKQDEFLNKDYRISGWDKNTNHPAIAEILADAKANTKGRKRIAIITTNNGSFDGGSEMLWQETAFSLRERNHDVVVLLKDWRPRPDIVHDLNRVGVRVLFKEEKGFELLLSSQPDLTVVSIGDQDEGTEYYKALRSANLPYVIVNQLTKEVRFWKRRAKKQSAVKKGYLAAQKVFFASKNNHAVMEDRLKCKIPNADIHFNPYHINRSDVPPYPGTDDGLQIAVPSKLLFIHKGQDLLIEALKQPNWRRRDVQFNLYGTGPDRQAIEKAIVEFGLSNLHLKGRVSDIAAIWRDNHALLMPSRMEGLPIMVVSALLSARVCIVTDVGGHAEVVQDNKSGFIISDPSVSDLLKTLEIAYKSKGRWQKMGERGRKDILKILPENPVSDFISRLETVWD